MTRFLFPLLAVSLAAPLCGLAEGVPDFNREVRPVLADKCFFCHGPDEGHRKGKLRLDVREGALKVVDEKNLAASELLKRITTHDAEERMPPAEANVTKALLPREVELLTKWVLGGAPYAPHWAFAPAKSPTPPPVDATKWRTANPIDQFIASRAAEAGLAQMPPAEKEVLIRRVTFDLTGLPPTPAEVDAFVADASPQAFEKVVDRLLASPRYGERMCLAWLDLARYGDSSAMHADGPRDMWPWRDWVIKACNDNMPFDRFTVEQLAGDLLPNATPQQKVASGFNRNNVTSDEGGAIPEELRVEYAVDRVKTTANTWLALSMECAQCHDHKYDPVTMTDYYQFFAFFNQAADPGMQSRGGNQAPVVEVNSPEREGQITEAKQAVAAVEQKMAARKKDAAEPFSKWLQGREAAVAKQPATAEPNGLVHFFPLDETEGAAVKSLGGLELTLSGKLQSTPRDAGKGLKFDGGTTYTCTAAGPEIAGDRPFSFAAYVKLPAGDASGALMSRMDEGADFRGWDIWLQGRGVGTHLIHAWPANALKVVSKDKLPPDKWTQVVLTYDGSRKPEGVRIYLNGKLSENTVEQNSLTETIEPTVPLKLGARNASSTFKGEMDDVRLYNRVLAPEELGKIGNDPVTGILALTPDQRTADQKEFLEDHYFSTVDGPYRQLGKELAAATKKAASLQTQKLTSMIMTDEGKMRPTYVLNRGQYDQPKKDRAVTPAIPAVFGSLPPGAPPNRLGLARWITSPQNPLTARVAVNRFWHLLFGEGLVRTLEDFGAQGEVPSHPELLDWLAADFVASGWDVKRCLRQMLLSETYRQSSRVLPDMREKDPENRLWARGPRFRLQGEFIRDNALTLSGLLVDKIGGPSVKPYQPPGIWEEVALDPGGTGKFVPDNGDKLYRRSMYIYWKRSAPHPTMLLFDAPTREKCTARRPRTNTPLQALATLNDPQFVEAARFFGERLIREGGAAPEGRIDLAFRLALGRHPTTKETQLLTKLAADQTAAFQADPKKAEQFLKVGEKPRDASIPAPEAAAWSVIASTVLNLDEVLTRG